MRHDSPADFGKLSEWHASEYANVCGYWKAGAHYVGEQWWVFLIFSFLPISNSLTPIWAGELLCRGCLIDIKLYKLIVDNVNVMKKIQASYNMWYKAI